jgi:4-amino-4-deoxy-L-arabinose transferase-like glycosyltransferase
MAAQWEFHMRALMSIAFAVLLLHIFTNGQYGFHRDELATLDDARYLAWGYVAYPPVTPFFGRLSLALFGLSVTGARLFPAMAQGLAIVLAGLMSRELGGGRMAQFVAGLAVTIAPIALVSGTLLQYVSFDSLWWALAAYFTVCLLRSGQPRWWLPIGAAVGFGMMTKYTMAFLAVGLAAGIVLTPTRRYLRSRWLWFGAGMAVLIFLPNVVRQNYFQSLIRREFFRPS